MSSWPAVSSMSPACAPIASIVRGCAGAWGGVCPPISKLATVRHRNPSNRFMRREGKVLIEVARESPRDHSDAPMIRSPVACPGSPGRAAPLRALLDKLERAEAGEGTVLLLGGDAGVGKSRLVRELKHEATVREVRVIEGRCSSTEYSVPYAPLMDALRFRI